MTVIAQPTTGEQPHQIAAAERPRPGAGLSEIGDRQAGLLAIGVIAGLATLLAVVLLAILLYSMSWGYSIVF